MLQDADRAMEEDKKENKENKDAGKREKEKTVIDGTMCIWIGDCHPKYMLLQPMEKEARRCYSHLCRNRITFLNGIRAIILRIRSSVLREALYGC
jgi:hypothetical protein